MEPTQSQGKVTRRGFLKVSGAALVLLAGGGLYRAVDKGVFATGKGPAYEPWSFEPVKDEERSVKDPFRLVQYAILAANAHNTQPWLFRVQSDQIELFADISRNIGAMDPYYREMYISLGCAIENLSLAAQAHRYEPQVHLLEGGLDQVKVAEVSLADRTPHASHLFHMITKRHTHRGAYDPKKPLSDVLLREITALGNDFSAAKLVWHTDQDEREQAGKLIIQATEAIIQDADQVRDSHLWYRQDRDDIQRFKDGTTFVTPHIRYMSNRPLAAARCPYSRAC
ncbi:twin-arginine translocation signal domain-containing protein [Xylanibacillus composti]|uniref:Twin-arginine translocation signal domain-containing protein n=1 Tax=Xylanibacillus composti TaxID=1572762 RepID=A0A8J4H8S9_9BACL|nr:twin-arginine translocation signal domain-containing protein [Xylanibacillus composti]GIQ70818.1 hypothetical protein XYCOK13_36420 [Xylanibacillus composti]